MARAPLVVCFVLPRVYVPRVEPACPMNSPAWVAPPDAVSAALPTAVAVAVPTMVNPPPEREAQAPRGRLRASRTSAAPVSCDDMTVTESTSPSKTRTAGACAPAPSNPDAALRVTCQGMAGDMH